MKKPSLLLTDTSGKWEVIGEPVKGDGWFGHSGGVHTVSIMFNNFIGGFALEATLALNPSDDDWFRIMLTDDSEASEGVLQLPENGQPSQKGIRAYTFIGNYVWLRARVIRNYISETPIPSMNVGSINRVLLAL